jgi:hypothetical protein
MDPDGLLIAHFQDRAERAEEKARKMERAFLLANRRKRRFRTDAEDWQDIAHTFRRLLVVAEEALVDNIQVHGDWFSQCFFMTEPPIGALILRWRDYRNRRKDRLFVPSPLRSPEEE